MGAIIPALALISWEILGRVGVLSEDGFSRPSRFFVAGAKALADGTLLAETAQTFAAAGQALAMAAIAGIVLGAILGLFRPLERAASLTIESLRPIPSVALIPLSLLLFGFSRDMSAWVAAFACFWPILLVTISSVRSVDVRLIEVGKLLGYSFPKIIVKFALPAALPGILVGIRVAAGIAIVVTVTTEIVTNPRGLGFAMTMAAQSLQADLVWATLMWVGVIGWLLNWSLERLERRWLRYR